MPRLLRAEAAGALLHPARARRPAVRRGRALPPAEAAACGRLGELWQLGGGEEGRELGDDRVGQLAIRRVLAQVPDGVGAADGIGLAQEVLGQADVPVRVGSAQLLERRTGALVDVSPSSRPKRSSRSANDCPPVRSISSTALWSALIGMSARVWALD